MENEITNNDILGPLVQRQAQHQHDHEHDLEERRKLLRNAKAKWSAKVEEMIANTDSWFINEDGDIVLIYPEPDNVENKEEKNERDDKNDAITKMIVENINNKKQSGNEFERENVSKEANINGIDGNKEQKIQVCNDDDDDGRNKNKSDINEKCE
eukprot:UN13420